MLMADDQVGPTDSREPQAGLTEPRVLSLERFPVRMRDRAVTQSGWRLAVVCAEGAGAIVLVETSPAETFFRGEGVFLGWPSERLEAAYRALLPRAEGPEFELSQFG
jgi:hypothetical protein